MRIGTREALNARREQAKAWLAAEQRVILVCAGTGCIAGGAMKVYDKLQELCQERLPSSPKGYPLATFSICVRRVFVNEIREIRLVHFC